MRERAAVLKGTFAIDAAPGRGTRVEVEIPLGREAT
jgi:signal transduction histidine kinase